MQRAQVNIKKGFYSEFDSQLQNSKLHDSTTLQYTTCNNGSQLLHYHMHTNYQKQQK